jgi:DNA-binding IclR family transcriptional regulator
MRHNPARRTESGGSASQNQSVDRALGLLELLAHLGEAGVTELAKELNVHKSTAFRLVVALENRQLVEQVTERGKYRLGFGIVRLAGAVAAHLDLPRESRPVCERLAAEVGETVNVAVLDAGAAINIIQAHGSAAVTARNWVGARTALHASSSGKVLLAWASEEELAAVLANKLQRYTKHTITSEAALRAELKRARARGWASTSEELETGLNSLAAPIRGGGGYVVAAVSIAGPSYRLTVDSFNTVAGKLVPGAQQISSRIGYFAQAERQPNAASCRYRRDGR